MLTKIVTSQEINFILSDLSEYERISEKGMKMNVHSGKQLI